VSPDDSDPVLVEERTHLSRSREALQRMQQRTGSLDIPASDHVSTQYLKATLYWRAKALQDDSEIALFFGRLDYLPEAGPCGTRFYIGRRHVTDA